MLSLNIDYFKSKPVNIPKITILLDHGDHPDHLREELEKIYPQIMRKIKFELSTKPSKQEKAAQGKSGFVPAIARWVIERSNSWMERCKILVKNFERTLSNATTKLNLCFVRLMIKRLVASGQRSQMGSIIEPLLPKKKRTFPPKWTKREILDGVLYQLKNGCNWCDLPKDLPPYSTVFWHYKQWRIGRGN